MVRQFEHHAHDRPPPMSRRVLHLLSQRPGWTGSGVALHAIVQAADRNGWRQMAVVGTPADDPAPTVNGLADANVRPLVFGRDELPLPLPGMSDVMPYHSSRFSQLSDDQLAAYRQAWKHHLSDALAAFQPDVIHSHHIWLLSALVKDLAPRTPVVTHCHGTGLRQADLCPRLSAEVRRGCSRNEAFLVLHRGQAEQVADALSVDQQRVHVIGSGFLQDVFHDRGRSSSDGAQILYAGKLSRAKGLPWLIDAVEQLAQRKPDLMLHVAGSGAGPESEAIRTRMEASERIVFHGQVDQRKLSDLMRRSAVFVLPSFFEGLPLVLVEAAACGCRLVATRLPGVVGELQPLLGESLELVSLPRLESTDQPLAEDLPAFVDHLTRAIEVSVARPPLNDIGTLVAGMTWDAVFDRIQAVWRQLLDGPSQ